MAELIAKTALDGKSVTIGGTTLAERDLGPVTSIAAFPGKLPEVNAGLQTLGLTFPAPNRFTQTADARLVWTGPDQGFLIGTPAPANLPAAITDQSGGWTALSLTGTVAADALMRLAPLDLHPKAFPPGSAARAPLGHMNMVLIAADHHEFLILIFRSMARTAFHEIETALHMLAARAAL